MNGKDDISGFNVNIHFKNSHPWIEVNTIQEWDNYFYDKDEIIWIMNVDSRYKEFYK